MTVDVAGLEPRHTAPETFDFPGHVIVDLDAIRENTATLVKVAGGREVMAVVKADAYGHGIVASARAAVSAGATWLGAAQVSEALQLRASGYRGPILAWLYSPKTPLGAAVAADIDVSISAPWALQHVIEASIATGRRARVHLKIDTGMSRNGATAADWPGLVAAARVAELDGHVSVVAVWSHFASAGDPGDPSIAAQLLAFEAASSLAHDAGLKPQMRHMANSAATLTIPEAHFDLVRPGLALYGLSPFADDSSPAPLRPAMRVEAELAIVKNVAAGVGVSYGSQFVTPASTVLAVVPMGYGAGIPRQASGRGPVLAGGRRTTVVGTICMDQFVIDLGPGSTAVAGDHVTLFGAGGGNEPTAFDWATVADTVVYEIVTRIAPRIPRTYIGTGAETTKEDW